MRISKSAPTPRYTILDSWLLLVMRSRKAGLPIVTRARKRELSIWEVRIENESDRKFSKSKFFQSFSENHFSTLFIISRFFLLVFQSLVKTSILKMKYPAKNPAKCLKPEPEPDIEAGYPAGSGFSRISGRFLNASLLVASCSLLVLA